MVEIKVDSFTFNSFSMFDYLQMLTSRLIPTAVLYPQSFCTQVICTQIKMISTQENGCLVPILFEVEIQFYQPKQC